MKFYDNAPRPAPVTLTLAKLATAVELHLTARGPGKLQAWRYLEAKLAEANDLLKAVI